MVEREVTHHQRKAVFPVVAHLAVVHLQNGALGPHAHHLVVVDDRVVDDGFVAGKFLKSLQMNAIRGVGDDGVLDEVVFAAFVDPQRVPLGVVVGEKRFQTVAGDGHGFV